MLTTKGGYGTERQDRYARGGRSATLPPNPKFCSVPRPLKGIVPRNSFSTSATLPPNRKFYHVRCPPRRAVPPHFRWIWKYIPFRVHCSISYRETHFLLPSHIRRTSNFVPFRVQSSISFRQPHFPLPLRFRAFLDFVPFRVRGSTNFRDDYTCVQTHTKYHLYRFCMD